MPLKARALLPKNGHQSGRANLVKRFLSSSVGMFLVSLIGAGIIAVLNYSNLWRHVNRSHLTDALKKSPRPILITWHEQLTAFPVIMGLFNSFSVLCSPHSDGRVIGYILRRFGHRAIWGSSNRQPTAALRALVREVKEGRAIAISPDGPRGPAHILAPGAISLAMMTGAPIVPAVWRSRRQWRAGGWDRMRFMKPFGRGIVLYGEPIFIPKTSDRDELERLRQDVEARFMALDRAVEAMLDADRAA